jgi:AcrR family transcriptional regulator
MAALDRGRIVAAAVALADRDGTASGLSLRSLAAELGVGTMSIYHYVANKEELLDAMVDEVFAEIDLPTPQEGWRRAMHRRCVSLRAALHRHPWAIGLMDSRAQPGPATLRHHDAVIGCLLANGFTSAHAAHAFVLMDSFVYGFALQAASLPVRGPADIPELAAAILGGDVPDRYPHLARLAREVTLQPGYDFEDEYARGLAVVLDALG